MKRVVAITGACTYLGGELLRRLEEDPRYSRILALDVRPPAQIGGKIEFIQLDLTQPTVDAELATLLDQAKVDTFVHGAFLSHPTHAAASVSARAMCSTAFFCSETRRATKVRPLRLGSTRPTRRPPASRGMAKYPCTRSGAGT